MLEAGLSFSRFAHYVAVSALFGIALFPLYSGLSRADSESARFFHWLSGAVATAAVATLVANVAWLALTTANMNGELSAAFAPPALWSVIQKTSFGHVWRLRLIINVILVAITLGHLAFRRSEPHGILVPLLSGMLLASVAGTGHTQVGGSAAGLLHVAADATHLLAAGAWLGGLIALAFILKECPPAAAGVLTRFSGMGYAAVSVLIGTGLVNSWFLVGSFPRLITTAYGQLLLVKLVVFTGMLGLAMANRFWLVPSLIQSADGSAASLLKLRQHVTGEQVLGALVLLIVSILGTMEPAMAPS